MTRDSSTKAGTRRKDRLLREWVHDPYRSKRKLDGPAVCPSCSAAYHDGRWQWRAAPPGAREVICPACDRIRDRYPAGQVTISGPFARENQEMIRNVISNQEARARTEHPLDRVMSIEDRGDALVVKTTDIHLPRAIGEALARAYEGELSYHYNEEEYYLGVSWQR